MSTVFLDYQASTPVLPEALEAMKPFFTERYGNPSSLHRHGLRARQALAQARRQFAGLLEAESPDDIIFTSGGTEAVNLGVKGTAWANQRRGKHLIASAAEHPAVLNAIAFLEHQGFTCTHLGVDAQGFIDPAQVQAALREDTILVCVQMANHDVGTIQPLDQIATMTNERGVPLFVDATAAAGWMPVNVRSFGLSLVALSAHRFYGPKGAGALYRQRGVRLTSLIHGGDQERGHRAGTENVPAVVGAGVAAEAASREHKSRQEHTAALQNRLWQGIRTQVAQVDLNGPPPGPNRLSTNLNVSAAGTEGEGQVLALDMAGLAVASGTACVSKAVKVSPVLQAMGIDRARALASILFSLGKDNTATEIDMAVAAYAKVIDKLRTLSASWDRLQSRSPLPEPSLANTHSKYSTPFTH